MKSYEQYDVAVIGAGYYGCYAATEIKRLRPELDVVIIEKEDRPFVHASSTNQGQFHMGYIYSADPTLAQECVDNKDRFLDEFGESVDQNVTSFYGVHRNSEISAQEYVDFCENLGLDLHEETADSGQFSDEVVALFSTSEKTFNSRKLQEAFIRKIHEQGITLLGGVSVESITEGTNSLVVNTSAGNYVADRVFNAGFAEINLLHESMGIPKIPLRYDVFLHFLQALPTRYQNVAATIIRGSFASLMPSSFRGGHILASGKFRNIASSVAEKPRRVVDEQQVQEVYKNAIEDCVTYMPFIGQAEYQGYTTGTRAAYFDEETGAYTSKPVVFTNYGEVSNYHVILGGKVSCMFDTLPALAEAAAS